MKAIALSVCTLAGAIMAVGGTIAENGARKTNQVDSLGTFLALAAATATIICCFRRDPPGP